MVERIDYHNLSDINKPNQPFEIIGKIKPIFSNGIWTYKEELCVAKSARGQGVGTA